MLKRDIKKDIAAWNKIDEISQGIYVIPQKSNVKMGEVRKYCKLHNKKYSELTDAEWENFTTNAGMLVCAK